MPNPPIPENTGAFQVIFHPAMRDALLQWADLCGYELSDLTHPEVRSAPTYLAQLRSVPGRLAQRCTVCSQLVDIANPGDDHEIAYRAPLDEPEITPFYVVHALEQSARAR